MGRGNLITLVVFAVVILVFPFLVTNPYYLRVISFTGIYTLICIGLSLLLGYAGQISMGQAGFFAIGAYGSGILTAQFGCSVWTGIIVGLGLSSLLAFVVGIPTLKLKGHYLAMATLGIGEVIHIVAVADTEDFVKLFVWVGQKIGSDPKKLADSLAPFQALTGGPSGFAQIPSLGIGSWELSTPTEWFYCIWGTVFVVMLLSINLIHSRVGRALRAIHGNEEAAKAMGVSTTPLKLGIFMISAGLASLAGSLYAHFVTFVSPETFNINASILFLVMVAVGGMMNVWGALVGTVLMSVLPEFLRLFHDFDILLYGLILLLIMMFMPDGVVGLLQSAVRRFTSRSTG